MYVRVCELLFYFAGDAQHKRKCGFLIWLIFIITPYI